MNAINENTCKMHLIKCPVRILIFLWLITRLILYFEFLFSGKKKFELKWNLRSIRHACY